MQAVKIDSLILKPELNTLFVNYSSNINNDLYLFGTTTGNLPNHHGNTISQGKAIFVTRFDMHKNNFIWHMQRLISGNIEPYSIQALSKSIIISMSNNNDAQISMYNNQGELLWTQTYGKPIETCPVITYKNHSIYVASITHGTQSHAFHYELNCRELDLKTGHIKNEYQFAKGEGNKHSVKHLSIQENYVYTLLVR